MTELRLTDTELVFTQRLVQYMALEIAGLNVLDMGRRTDAAGRLEALQTMNRMVREYSEFCTYLHALTELDPQPYCFVSLNEMSQFILENTLAWHHAQPGGDFWKELARDIPERMMRVMYDAFEGLRDKVSALSDAPSFDIPSPGYVQ